MISAATGVNASGGDVLPWWAISPLAAIPLVMFLSLADAVLTLFLLEHGAHEFNPLMAYFLTKGPLAFISAKLVLTCGPLLIVYLNQDASLFRTGMRAGVLLSLFPIPYLLVIQWEVFLLLFRID